ncbi:ty3-gypsy retrotransposon protein [Cucumis melo var. makuwa]|uniref:Ty3-gypsy retrotransposon protein n=1 Tax=Cucumis melo var. makuwa TaxID=1194695 RepID=A0A5D3C3J8_CUCMM|nr:ty3-gypsy retrotransposon protein [Cucumis melo var. makuwa]
MNRLKSIKLEIEVSSTPEVDHPQKLKLLYRSKLSSKTPTSRTPSKFEAPLKIQAFFEDSNFKNITCFASSNQVGTSLPLISLSSFKSTRKSMASKKAASDSSVANDAYTGPITRSRFKGIIQEQDQGSNVAQSILKQLMESPKAGIVIKENPLYDNSDSASSKSKKEAHPDVMSVMMADITTEASMAEMERKINFLMNVVEERDHEITALREQMQTREPVESSQTLVVKATDKGKNMV